MKTYRVHLTDDERGALAALVRTGRAAARKLTHARVLLKADEAAGGAAWTDARIVDALGVSEDTVQRLRKRAVEEGPLRALERRRSSRVPRRKLDGRAEAQLSALTCSTPPEGREGWTLRLLADTLVELEYVDCVSYETVRRVLERSEIKPWLKEQWVIPPAQDAAFVAAMEDVLDVYARPYDPRRPGVCLDETSKQLVAETRTPLPLAPGRPARFDYEYERRGVANLFLLCEPLRGWRHIAVRDQRTRVDWAHVIKDLVDKHVPHAERIVLVQDNLNTHTLASLYATFPPAEAQRLARKLELHYTPKHGSWLNVAELELAILTRQVLAARIPDPETLAERVIAWFTSRNARRGSVRWRFTTADARIKLHHLYPLLPACPLTWRWPHRRRLTPPRSAGRLPSR